jgi:hypothetical protein
MIGLFAKGLNVNGEQKLISLADVHDIGQGNSFFSPCVPDYQGIAGVPHFVDQIKKILLGEISATRKSQNDDCHKKYRLAAFGQRLIQSHEQNYREHSEK